MPPYRKMFEPRVPGFVHIQALYPYRYQGAKPGETVGQAAARRARGGDPARGRRHGGRLHRRADPRRRRRDPPARRLLPAHPRDLRRARRALHRRRGHHRLLPHRQVVRARALERAARHHVLRQGRHLRLPAARRHHGDRRRSSEAMDAVKPEDRWMHAYTYSGHPTCCAVGLANIEIMERERLWERAAAMGKRLHDNLHAAFGDHKHVGDIRERQGAPRRDRAGRGQGHQGALRRGQEGGAARAAGDGQARRHDARPARAHLLRRRS